jgi:peptide-methionine (R)-S-oxide reductase
MRNIFVIILSLSLGLVACQNTKNSEQQSKTEAGAKTLEPSPSRPDRIVKSDEDWRKLLSEEEFNIIRKKGTERAFTGDLLYNKKHGHYTCAACGLELFSSDTKFESGTGWPSFYDEIGNDHVGKIEDRSYGMVRTEVVCNRCGGHLGHVFDDGPKPTGLRYCINSLSLNFVEKP